MFEFAAVLFLEASGDGLGDALVAEEEVEAFAFDLVVGDVDAAFAFLCSLDLGGDLGFEAVELLGGEGALVRADLQDSLVVAAGLPAADVAGDPSKADGEGMLFEDGLSADGPGDGDQAGEHAVLFFAVGMERGVLKLGADGEHCLQVALKCLVEGLLDPGVLVFVGVATRAGGDVEDDRAFGEPGCFEVAGEADAVFVDGAFDAAFDAEHFTSSR